MITFDDVEQHIESYFDANNQKSPVYILMDEKTYDDFNTVATPKEKNELFFERSESFPKITAFHSKSGIVLQVLCIKSTSAPIFAVVGN